MPRFGALDVTINVLRLQTLDFRTNPSDTSRREVGRSIFVDKSSSRDVTRFKLHQLSGLRVRACTGFSIFFSPPRSFIPLLLFPLDLKREVPNTPALVGVFLVTSLERPRGPRVTVSSWLSVKIMRDKLPRHRARALASRAMSSSLIIVTRLDRPAANRQMWRTRSKHWASNRKARSPAAASRATCAPSSCSAD